MLDEILPVYRFSSPNIIEDEIPQALDNAWRSLIRDEDNLQEFAHATGVPIENLLSIKESPFNFEVEKSGSTVATCIFVIFIAASYKLIFKPALNVGEKKMTELFEEAFDEHLLPRFRKALGRNNQIEKK